MDHPYKENENNKSGAPRYGAADFGGVDDIIDRAVEFGSRVGSNVLGSISDALRQSMDSTAPADDFAHCRRALNNRLGTSQGGYMALGVAGWFLGGSFLIAFIVMASLAAVAPSAAGVFTGTQIQVFDILAAVFGPVSAGFMALGWFGVHKANRYGRLRRYLKVLRGWSGTLAQIARDAVISPGKVRRDLQKAVAAGRLGAAYYDAESDTLYLDGSQHHPAAPQPADAAEAEPTAAERFAQQGAEFLAYLRTCKGRLTPDTDAELDAMQRNCEAILGFIRSHPDRLPAVRRLAEYYLPTTRKLLDTALGLGSDGAGNAQAIRRDITGILHTLNTAFARLYDTLLQDVSLDVSVEIDTLEAMLEQDGLTRGFAADFKPQQE